MEVTCQLWDSWQDDALIRDKDLPLFADPHVWVASTTPENGSTLADRSMSAARLRDVRSSSRRVPLTAAETSRRDGLRSFS